MSCTTAVFTLMAVASALGCLALYTYMRNILETYKQKVNSLNTALTNLQEERGNLIAKSENMFLENATQTAEIERLYEEINKLKIGMNRMEKDNLLVMQEYSKLEDSFKIERAYVSLNGHGERYNALF